MSSRFIECSVPIRFGSLNVWKLTGVPNSGFTTRISIDGMRSSTLTAGATSVSDLDLRHGLPAHLKNDPNILC
jgi:hypothetical protein